MVTICIKENCKKRACFGNKHEKTKFCKQHKEINMIDLKHKTCQFENCQLRPSFGNLGEKIKFCKNHKDINMIDLTNRKKCKFKNCLSQPNFGNKGEKSLFCSEHKEDDMIDLSHTKCQFIGCDLIPIFGNINGKAIFCKEHKEDNMIDLKHKTCQFLDCKTLPSFGLKGGKIMFCKKHKEIDMIDLTHKICQVENCQKRACFGILSHSACNCSKHKKEGMIKNPTKQCNDKMCKKIARFGIKYPLHCDQHKDDDEEDLTLQKCKKCNHIEICNKDQICFEYCINSDLFNKHIHVKEKEIIKLLQTHINQKFHSTDVIIDSTCNLKRPDIVYETPSHFVAIEIDEDQHKGYLKGCEISRMKEITQAIGMPTIFIRYNPDNYNDINNKKSKLIKKKKEELLITWIKHILKLPPTDETEFLRVVYLFYDKFEENNCPIYKIDIESTNNDLNKLF